MTPSMNAHNEQHDSASPVVKQNLTTQPAAAQEAVAIEVPNGAIFNGNAYADRLETYGFECEAGPLTNCNDWVEFRRCFNHLADWAYSLPPLYAAPVTAAPAIEALKRIKLRLHFVDMPGESMWDRGDGVWVPDWRYEIQLIEHVLHGSPIKAAEKPTDTRKRIEVEGTPAAPGIDLEPFRRLVEWNYDSEFAAYEHGLRTEEQREEAEAERTRLLTLIDASSNPVAAPLIDLADVSLAAQMLTWGREEGLTEGQIAEIDAHAQKLFALTEQCDASPKTFQPTRTYSLDILGNPMRQYEPGKWESARWPSDASPKGGSEAINQLLPPNAWPRWADRHVWDANGEGWFYGAIVEGGGEGLEWNYELQPSGIAMPPEHDWRVPVLRTKANSHGAGVSNG